MGGKENFDELTNVNEVCAFAAMTWITEETGAGIAPSPTHLCFVLNGQQIKDNDINEKTFNLVCSMQNIDRSRTDGKSIQVLWFLSRYDPEGVTPKADEFKNNEECLELMKSWARNGFFDGSPFRQVILDTFEDTKVTPLVIRARVPISDLLEAPERRVVLVGDAVQPMTIYRGEGNK